MTAITITTRDRLTFTFFLAISLHAAVILGVTFASEFQDNPSPTIEVTLAQHNDEVAPEDTDFIAQANQLGSGELDEAVEKTTDQQAEFFDEDYNEVIPEPEAAVAETLAEKKELLSTIGKAEEAVTTESSEAQEENTATLLKANETYESIAQEIASLEARIAEERQAQAKSPRIKRVTSVSTKTADEAAYLNMWRQKVERVGNSNYPSSAVAGNLRMLVIIKQDGTLKEVRLLDSSGVKVLDDAALRIVRLAAPYQDFPVEMRKKYDELEIIRTWQFSSKGNRLGS